MLLCSNIYTDSCDRQVPWLLSRLSAGLLLLQSRVGDPTEARIFSIAIIFFFFLGGGGGATYPFAPPHPPPLPRDNSRPKFSLAISMYSKVSRSG